MSPHEQSMRVDGIRRACDEGHVVRPRFDCKRFGLLWQHRENLIDLIGKCLLEDLHVKDVAKLHLVELGEEFCGRQPAMSGDRRVGGRAAHGQRRGLDVPRGYLQDFFLGGVVDGHGLVEARDGDVAHHARAGEVEQAHVLFAKLGGQ